jgi:hypothetical protein
VLITSNDPPKSDAKEEDKQKVFINFTQHDDIAAPGIKKQLNNEGKDEPLPHTLRLLTNTSHLRRGGGGYEHPHVSG